MSFRTTTTKSSVSGDYQLKSTHLQIWADQVCDIWVIDFQPRATYLCSLSVSTALSSNPHQNLLCNFESTKIHSSDDEQKVFGKYSRKFPTSVLKYWESSICRIFNYYLACVLLTQKRKYQHRRMNNGVFNILFCSPAKVIYTIQYTAYNAFTTILPSESHSLEFINDSESSACNTKCRCL